MCKLNYIQKYYAFLAYGLCVMFFVVLGISASLTFNSKELTYGIIILLFADISLAILSLVSMIAMFREVSRLHAREFPKDVIDQMNELGEKLDQLSDDFNSEKNHIEKITSLSRDCAQLKEKVEGMDGKIDGIICQHGCVGGSGKGMRIMDAIKNPFNKIRNRFSSKRKKQSETATSSDALTEQKGDPKTSGEGGSFDIEE